MGAGGGLSDEERATRQAENGEVGAGAGAGGTSTVLLDEVISYLEGRGHLRLVHWLRFFFGLTPGAEIGYDVCIL